MFADFQSFLMFPLFAKQHSQAHDMWWAASEILLGRYLNTCCFLGFVLLLAHNLVCFFKTLNFWHTCVLSCFSCVQLFATPWTEVHQAPLSMGFSRQEYWSGLPSPPPGDLPDPGIEPVFPASQVNSLPTKLLWKH